MPTGPLETVDQQGKMTLRFLVEILYKRTLSDLGPGCAKDTSNVYPSWGAYWMPDTILHPL